MNCTADRKAVSPIRTRYGNITLVSPIVSSSLAGSRAKPGAMACTITGARMIPRAVTATRTTAAQEKTALRNSPSSAGRFSLYSVMTGTKDELAAPSPIKSRKRFGSRKASTKASALAAVPKKRAKMMSRTKPSTRLARVPRDITEVERRMLWGE